ncbi:NINE protein [Paenibacillus antibioticophila]|uniref:NINE protein n=1 Tax=Paenibacillus antibioticophila TaxID=1274374 RepID=UPI0005C948AD|nr:TM2 domain-containing protein [Paenibacillus antibioticophila]
MQFSKHDLTTTEMLILNSEMNKREKSLALAYLMLLAGHLGVHRFYLKRIASGVIQLVLFVLTFVFYLAFGISSGLESEASPDTFYSLIFLVPLLLAGLGLTIWVIVDACMLPGMVRSWNQQLEQSLVAQIASHRTDTDNNF